MMACESGGCGWNKGLELKFYQDNVAKHGVVRARELSRANARSHRNEKTGTPTDWTVELSENGEDMIMDDGSSLLGMVTVNPFIGPRAHLVTDSVRETAKVEGVTIRSAIQLAARGERQIIFPEHHLTSDGFVARYFTVWKQDEYNPRKYHGKRIDLGKNIPIDETRSMIRERMSSNESVLCHQNEQVKQAFVFSTKHVSISHIDAVIHEGVVMTRRIIRDTYDTVGSVVTAIRQSNSDKKIQQNSKEIFEIPEKKIKNILDGKFGQKILHALTSEPLTQPKGEKTISQIWRETAEKLLHITPEEAEKLEHTVHTTWKRMNTVRKQIALSVDTGVGIGGAVFALESIASMKFEYEGVFKDKLEKAVMTIVTGKNDSAIVHVKPIEHLIDIVEQRSEEKMSPTDEAIVLTWLKEFIPTLDRQTPELAVIRIDNEQKRIAENVQLICEVIKENFSKETIHKEHAVRDFSFAVTLWMILKYMSYHQRLESIKKAIVSATVSDIVASKSHLSEALVPQESTSSWLLFAIIRYLAMIREQGAINASGIKYHAKKKKKSVFSSQIVTNIPIEQRAVIFAFAS